METINTSNTGPFWKMLDICFAIWYLLALTIFIVFRNNKLSLSSLRTDIHVILYYSQNLNP